MSSSSRVDEKCAESWNKVFWIQYVMVGFVVPVLADNPLAYSCLCPVSLHLVAKTGLRVAEVAQLGCRKRLTH